MVQYVLRLGLDSGFQCNSLPDVVVEGKSTFLNIITGHLTPDEGKIEWAKNVRTGYLDQHTALEKGMTVRENIRFFQQKFRQQYLCSLSAA